MDKRTYLMLGGTFLPAFAGVIVYSIATKEDIKLTSIKILSIFAAMSAVGGYVTAQILKEDGK